MITPKREPMAERISDAADAVKHAWEGARERGAEAVDAARDKAETVRHKVGDAQDALADQLESAADALRRSSSKPVRRMARDRPMSTILVAFAAGFIAATLAGVVMNATRDE
jgi:ElaB/YqjD/DUF883 family membrane-anchored ribosome-binding protein